MVFLARPNVSDNSETYCKEILSSYFIQLVFYPIYVYAVDDDMFRIAKDVRMFPCDK